MVKDFLYTPASLAALEETLSTQALASLLCNRKPTSPDRVLTELSFGPCATGLRSMNQSLAAYGVKNDEKET